LNEGRRVDQGVLCDEERGGRNFDMCNRMKPVSIQSAEVVVVIQEWGMVRVLALKPTWKFWLWSFGGCVQ
jgi:hypothetical protein